MAMALQCLLKVRRLSGNTQLLPLRGLAFILNNHGPVIMYQLKKQINYNNIKFTFKANTIMGKVSKETRREQRYNANLHNLFVKAQEEIANE